ncbi:MAG: hypothetical protein M3548_14555 [Actinomycetota bacterium]|nr:hypothetical protein [Actinomycetota bacterium]
MGLPTWLGPRLAAARGFFRRTEGKLVLLLVILVVAVGGVGAAAAGAAGRASLADEVTTERAKVVRTAQEVHRALSDADATSFNAVLVDAVEGPKLRDRFRQDLATATDWLSATGADGDWVALVSNQLPVYAGLVETGWVYTRQGQPLGAAYLREASHVLRSEVLIAVERAYTDEVDGLIATQDDAGSVPWVPVLLTVLVLAGLVGAQIFVARLTHRRFNPGLVAATLLTTIGLVWLAITSVVAVSATDRAVDDGMRHAEKLAHTRDFGLRADAHEAMALIFRDDADRHRVEVSRALDEVDSLLYRMLHRDDLDLGQTRTLLADASAVAGQWRTAPLGDRTGITSVPTYVDAVRLVINDAGHYFDTVLSKATQQAMDRFDVAAAEARDAWAGLAVVLAALTLLAMVASVAGLAPRLVEYR